MRSLKILLAILMFLTVIGWLIWYQSQKQSAVPPSRSEVVLWHFWGGEDRDVVESVVRAFNDSQETYFVRAVAMPGNNLQAKLFLSVTGGAPPDIVNQDDPILADWAVRGVIQPIDDFAASEQIKELRQWWLPAADRLSTIDDRVFGVCNGLDIRALFYNQTMLTQYGLDPPATLDQLDDIAQTISPPGKNNYQQMGYLPDARRLLAWSAVFGATVYDPDNQTLQLDSPETTAALQWMSRYGQQYGADQIASFRKTDQSLPGGLFPLLPVGESNLSGRYAVVMDGQWRVRNITAFQNQRRSAGLPVPEFGVCPLPTPDSPAARTGAGWVNGNFFVFPKGSKNPQGAWEFAKFWIGFHNPQIAATTCRQGGWIPVSQSVIQTSEFQSYLKQHPMFGSLVELAQSPNQFPTPPVVGAGQLKRALERVGYQAVYQPDSNPSELLQELQKRFSP